jgi:hypothetical protein
MIDEQEGNPTGYLPEFWLQDYEIQELFQLSQSYDASL